MCGMCGAGLLGVCADAKDPAELENQLKGAFLVKFALFVEWPPRAFMKPNDPIVLGILGKDPFGDQFELAVQTQVANGRRFVLKRFQEPNGLEACHILFISSSEKERLPEILQALRNSFTLTVGDLANFAEQGGILEFIKEEGKVRFEINVDAAESKNLKISAKLLQVSKPIRRGP